MFGHRFDKPTAIVALGGASGLSDGQSVVYVADSGNSCLRRISTGNRHGDLNVGTLCGQAGSPGGTDGAFAEALFTKDEPNGRPGRRAGGERQHEQ